MTRKKIQGVSSNVEYALYVAIEKKATLLTSADYAGNTMASAMPAIRYERVRNAVARGDN